MAKARFLLRAVLEGARQVARAFEQRLYVFEIAGLGPTQYRAELVHEDLVRCIHQEAGTTQCHGPGWFGQWHGIRNEVDGQGFVSVANALSVYLAWSSRRNAPRDEVRFLFSPSGR